MRYIAGETADPMNPTPPLTVEGMSVSARRAQRMWLDGNSMFGVVPKPLWERKRPADDRNRVEFDANCLLVETGGKRVLVDSGYGSNPSPRQRQHQSLEEGHPILDNLAKLSVSPDQIDLVVLTICTSTTRALRSSAVQMASCIRLSAGAYVAAREDRTGRRHPGPDGARSSRGATAENFMP